MSIAHLSRLLSIGASESLLFLNKSLTAPDTTGSHNTIGTGLFLLYPYKTLEKQL